VKFDKLHKSLTNDYYVPFIGDLMTSRWAFEALAVEQFKNNRYQRTLFPYEQQLSEPKYLSNYLIDELRARLDESWQNIYENQNPDKLANDLRIISNETKYLLEKYPQVTLQVSGQLNPESFDEEMYQGYTAYIEDLTSYVRRLMRALNMKITETQTTLMNETGNLDAYSKLEKNNYNKKLSDMVLDHNNLTFLVLKDDHYIRKYEPIYQIPTSPTGRAHLYAPVKRLGNAQLDTLWFNVIFIWFTTMLLYITLYFDLLRKILTFTESVRLRKQSRT
jgi:hypothetical protein